MKSILALLAVTVPAYAEPSHHWAGSTASVIAVGAFIQPVAA